MMLAFFGGLFVGAFGGAVVALSIAYWRMMRRLNRIPEGNWYNKTQIAQLIDSCIF